MSSSPLDVTTTPIDSDHFRLLVEAITDHAIYMLDPDGRVVSWNTGAEQLKGYRRDEILGQSFARFFPPEDQAAKLPARILAEARSTGRAEVEGWRVSKNGGRFWALSVVTAVRDPSGTLIGLAVITRDMTERWAAQEALIESERRFRLLVDGVIDYAIFMLDPGGVVTNWNQGAQRINGYIPDEIVGRHFSLFYTKEDRNSGLPARTLETARREGRFEAEGWRVRKDGGRFWASVVIDAIRDEAGRLVGFVKITRDITERRQAQEALRDSERQFRLLVSGVTDYALFMLDPNGVVSSWNAGAERIKGYAADEIIGHHFSRFYTEADRSAGMPARALRIAADEGRFESEGWRVRKDGSLFWTNVVIDAIRDEQGQLIGFAKITRDTTERREAQKRLQRTQEQLAQAQKMEALGQLTGGVAHDFNNLLMIVSGQLRALKKVVDDDPKGTRAANAIELAIARGQSLTRQLLTFSRRQNLEPTIVDLHDRVQAIRAILASSAGKASRLLISVAPDVWPIEVDVSELELALVNLVVNARDASPEDSPITIVAENVPSGSDGLPGELKGDFVGLTVADAGSGIPEDILPKVFDPFFTTKPSDKGTGLGLSQVHGFAHQAHGAVTIDSQVGRGTRVTIYVPRTHSAPLGQVPGNEDIGRAAEGKVLLVEDNPEVASATRELLEELGYDVTVASDARGALEAVEAEPVDVVLSDIVMGGPANGLDLARAIRERRPELPIVLATGYSTEAERAAREFVVLRKPYQLAELSRAIARSHVQLRADGQGNLVYLNAAKRDRATGSDGGSGA